MEGRVFENFRKKSKIFKIPKSRKSLPKVSKRVLNNIFWGKFFEKLLPSFPWRVESSKFWEQSKKSQKSKYAQSFSQKCPNVFWTCFGAIFSKIFCPAFHGRSSLRKISKKPKNFKVPKLPKRVPKSIQTRFERVLAQTFRKTFAQFPMEGRVFQNFRKKTKNFQSSKKAENRYQKCPNVFWTCFGAIFSKKYFCPVFHGG